MPIERKKKIEGKPMQEAPPQTSQNSAEQPVSNEEQLMRRQSAPRPTMESEALRMLQKQQTDMLQGQGMNAQGALNGFKALTHVIGKEQVRKANTILQRYKEGKAKLEQRIVENEQWYKIRHWECMRKKGDSEVEPSSAWLFNCIANKHADAMDNFPSPNILPREESDKAEAEKLTSIVPVILEQNEFEETYSDVMSYKLKMGTGVYGIFWDKTKLNGLGDISIRKIDLINLYWESGITDIQKSRNIFHCELVDNDLLESAYPQLVGKLGQATLNITKYIYDDTVDTNDKSIVVDWYYKKAQGGRTVLHYVKYVNDEVLYATENELEPIVDEKGKAIRPPMAETGWYDHGMYPFVFDPLFTTEGTPTGFGYIDVGKDSQEYIDRGNQAIMKNMLANAKPRHFIRSDGSVNEEEYADTTKDFIHVDSGLGQDSILPVQGKPLNDIYVHVINNKIEELKETTGNRDVSTGGTTGGVTAASAIAAQMEAGSKLSRDSNKASYRAFRKICLMVIELIRQFYDLPRCFRIMGENGAARYIQYSNAGIQLQSQGMAFGVNMGDRLPLFDIEITAQKQSPYSKMAQNELALQFFGAGFFNPQIADQALACLDMMDFDRKHFIIQKIAQNGGMYQQMMQMQQQMVMLAQIVDSYRGSNIAQQLIAQFNGKAPIAPIDGGLSAAKKVDETEALGGKEGTSETANMKKSRQRVAESTDPT